MNLSSLKPPAGSKRKRKRVGRGPGSGLGKTAGRGEKGQKSRSGYSRKRGFEGGQMPLVRRVPKRGFHNIFRTEYRVLNLSRLEKLEGDEFTPETLLASGALSTLGDGLKILGEGEITRAVSVTAHKVSKTAREKIEAAGGKVTLIEPQPRFTREIAEKRKAEAAAAKPKAAKPEPKAVKQAAPAPKKAAVEKKKAAAPPAAEQEPKAAPKKAAKKKAVKKAVQKAAKKTTKKAAKKTAKKSD